MTISSMRFKNSGRKLSRIAAITLLRISSCREGSPAASRILSEPMFEVKTMMQFLKLTRFPLLSVRRPSSRSWSIRLNTSGCAFSISSKSTTAYGRRRIASVKSPPCSKPTYPGGAPMSLETVCFSMYSDMSRRTMASSLSNMAAASALQISVLPTPVGPRKASEAMGLSGSLRPALERCTASAMAAQAGACPLTRSSSSLSRPSSLSRSEATSLVTGTPVHELTIEATSSGVMVSRSILDSPSSSLANFSSSAASSSTSAGMSWYLSSAALFRSNSRSACSMPTFIASSFSLSVWMRVTPPRSFSHAAFASACSERNSSSSLLMASRRGPPSFSRLMASISSWITLRSISSMNCGLLEISLLSLAHASSTRSMALSGKKRSAMYRSLSEAAATRALSRTRTPWWTS
mmetsp:Transcript_61997/g.140273  ORF Transcript_61997/g.140273 Transcript_61997/m.140273 type:complete len:407 (-) Transcript_61997:1317-2537(-)